MGIWQSSVLYNTTMSIISFCQDESGKLWVGDYVGGALYPIKSGAPTPVNIPWHKMIHRTLVR